jgi:hypothetical protein
MRNERRSERLSGVQDMPVEEVSNRTPLYGHSIDSLCAELVSGRGVTVGNNEEFKFDSDNTRVVFSWYVDNKEKWAGRNMVEDVERMVDRLKKRPPAKPAAKGQPVRRQKRYLHLARIQAHRFAGIHRYGNLTEAPKDFDYCFEKPVTLIEGKNASGKTSLLNAIVWCLTGHVYRSQREPEKIEEEIDIKTGGDGDTESLSKTCLPIVPLPDAPTMRAIGDKPVPQDTWVELTFVDDDGKEVGKVKRTVSTTSRGKTTVGVVGIESLGVDPVALEIGTKVPGLIPYIQLEQTSELGRAIAALTPLRPLEDLVKHARKSQDKLRGDLTREREVEIERLDTEYTDRHVELKTLIENSPGINIALDVPQQAEDKTSACSIRKMKTGFEVLEASVLGDAKNVLGEGFDPQDAGNRKDLSDNVGRALGLLDPVALKRLPSAQRLANLKELPEDSLRKVEAEIRTLLTQAREIEELSRSHDRAVREMLYARVGSWIRENKAETHICPVCQDSLGTRSDKVTGRRITDHLEEHTTQERGHLAKAIGEWGESCRKRLKAELPTCLASESDRDLPTQPQELIAKAMEDELFDSVVFARTLAPLKEKTRKLCKNAIAALPQYHEPEQLNFSQYLLERCPGLCTLLTRINRALAFARWRSANEERCREAFGRIIGDVSGERCDAAARERELDSMPLLDCLQTLDRLNKNTEPIREALLKVQALRRILESRRKEQRRVRLYARAERAIQVLLKLDRLVELQVASLMKELSGDIKSWRERMYCIARVGVPEVAGTDIGPKGSLLVEAEVGGTKASARHISNASDLRATLLAVLISFWKRLTEERGGLSLILLDDLQELFDKPNQDRIARSIRDIAEAGGKLIVTTNDPGFGRQVADSCEGLVGGKGLDRCQIHPLNAVRLCVELGRFREEIDVKRAEFEKRENENEDQPARDYVKDLRIYIENRLLDFFDMPCPSVSSRATMSELMNALKKWRAEGHEPFASPAFCSLLDAPALRPGSRFAELMNKSHHGRESEIAYRDVYELRSDCVLVRDLIDAAHTEYELWSRRSPRPSVINRPAPPHPVWSLAFDVPLFENLAAASAESGLSEIAEGHERLSNACLGEYAVYLINTDNLGFSAPRNSRAIVSLTEGLICDNSLVIALHEDRVYARRFLRHESNPEIIALSSESANPMRRIRSLLLPAAEVQVLQIIGILFDERPHWPKEGEAVLLETYALPKQITTAFRVRGESALPLALPGQKVLGADRLLPTQLEENRGELVAVAFSGREAFKRIGQAVPGQPRLRVLESIGGLGDSILIRTEEVDNDPFEDVPAFETAYRIVGVLYDNA